MQLISLLVVLAAGIWLLGVGFLMALRPEYCLHLLGLMSAKLEASNWRLNLIEQGIRLLAGAALILRSPYSKMPWLLWVFGWMIVISSLIILVVPVKWHGAFGTWWSRRLTPSAIRMLSPIPAVIGAGLIYLAT